MSHTVGEEVTYQSDSDPGSCCGNPIAALWWTSLVEYQRVNERQLELELDIASVSQVGDLVKGRHSDHVTAPILRRPRQCPAPNAQLPANDVYTAAS